MGSLQAMEMRIQTETQGLSMDAALLWHLTSNHFPPVPATLVPVARAAIAAANMGDWQQMIPFPDGFPKAELTAGEIVEGLHLEAFLDDPELYECAECGMPHSECCCD
jgi:hypothetical protein